MSYIQLTYEEGVTLSILCQQGLSVRSIARIMPPCTGNLSGIVVMSLMVLPGIKSTATYTGTAQPITQKQALHRNGFFIDL